MNLKQSAAYTRMFLMVQSGDHTTPATGLTVTVTISKAGGAFGSPAGTVTEVANGWYKIALTTADTSTAGDLAYHCTAAGADPTDFVDQVGPVSASVDFWQGNPVNVMFAGSTLPMVTLAGIREHSIDSATVFVGATPTTTDFDTSFTTDVGANSLVGQSIYFTTGANAGRTFRINAYAFGSPTAGRVHLTVSTMPNAPANGDSFAILGRIGQ